MTITATTLDATLKELYAGQAVENLVYDERQRPFLTRCKKFMGFAGRKMPFPVIWEDVGGRSRTFATAQSNVAASEIEQWEMDVKVDYGVARITGEALLRARNDPGAFLRGLKHLVDSTINRVSNNLEASLFRAQSGTIGTISSIATAGDDVITLTDANDIVNFFVNQKLEFAANATSALRAGGPETVKAVDRNAGTVTITGDLDTSVAANDLIFNQGDYVSASDTNSIAGLTDWLPASAPGTTAFFGVDRSQDTRLGGLRTTGSTSDVEGSILEGAALLGRESGSVPDQAWMSYTTYRLLTNELGAKVERMQGGTATGGFQSLQVYGPRGLIDCIPAPFMQDNLIYLLNSSTYQLVSMDEPVQILMADGLRIQRVSNADSYEVRVGGWNNLVVQSPGKNCRITLS